MRLLDLFCGAGGAAVGYHRAGFDVVGVDINPQPNYPFRFVQADAVEFLDRLLAGGTFEWIGLGVIDAIHASPPCPYYANVTRWRGNPDDHPALIEPVRQRLHAAGVPWVIENVRTPELNADLMLCGSMFDLPVRRHRYFQTSGWAPFQLLPPCRHRATDLPFMHKNERAYADALGCPWMTNVEGRDAIPPAYTEWIGRQLADHIEGRAA